MNISDSLAAFSIRRPYFAAVLNLLIIIAGIAALLGIEVRELPDVDHPIVSVRANYPGGSPETIDAEITSVIEGAVARVNGVTSVRSSSEENNFRINIEFNPTVDLIDAANDVREAVSRIEAQLPTGVEDVTVIKADNDARPIIKLSVYSNALSIEDVTRRVEDEIIPELTSVDGVASVQLFGERQKVLRVVVDPLRLAGYKISVSEVADVLGNARYDVPAGSFKSGEQEVIVRANASVTSPEEIERLIIRDPVRIGDVAAVFFGPADAENYVRLNGRTVVNLEIVRRASSNTVSISKDVQAAIDKLSQRYDDIVIETVSDDSVFIEGAVREVLISLLLAVVIVVGVIAVFMRQMRAALIPAAAIPVALIGTVAAIWAMGFSINLITLLALVLATGLVVDDAIVVLENIQRLRATGMPAGAAAVIGTRQVFFAIVATTATLVSVFLPISFLPTTAGRLFTEFGFVLAATVIISSFVALTVGPMLAARLPSKKVDAEMTAGPGLFTRAYMVLLDAALAAPLVLIGLCAVIGVAAMIVFQSLGEELVPEEDRGVISVMLTGPDGVGLDYTDRQVEKVEQLLAPYIEDGTITKLFTITGRWDLNRGWVDAPLLPWSERTVSEGDIAAQLSTQIGQIPGARGHIWRSNSLNLWRTGGGIKFALTGANYDDLAEAARTFVLAMERDIPGLENVRIEFRATQPQLSVTIDRRRASDLGVSIEDLRSTIQVLVDNDEVAELTIDDQAVPIILQASEGAIKDPTDLQNLYVKGNGDNLVPLSQLVTFKEIAVAAELDRHGQRRAVEIDGGFVGDFTMRQAVDAVRELARKELPPGIDAMMLYGAAQLDETSNDLTLTFMIAILVVFLVLVAQFESLTSGAIVILTVPFGVCAAVFALALTGTTINIYSQIGVLMLIGIMAKNAILMVEFADQLREQGRSVYEAAREASLVRLRPILMTMTSTVLAGLPLILGSGPGAEARSAIGWVVFGGLGLAGTFTLILTPALYVLIAGLSKPRNLSSERLSAELEEAQALPGVQDRPALPAPGST